MRRVICRNGVLLCVTCGQCDIHSAEFRNGGVGAHRVWKLRITRNLHAL
jgi:hypothetical protein